MIVVEVGTSEMVVIEERPRGLRLYPAIAGAQIELQFTVKTLATEPALSARPFHVAGDLFVARSRGSNERMMCGLAGKHLVTPTASGSALTVRGFISTEQLRVVESVRAAGDLVLRLDLALFTTGERLERFQGTEYLDVHGGVWTTEIERIDVATFVEVLVPMPTAKTYADALVLVREGRELLREGDEAKNIDSALIRARMALEPIRRKLRTINLAKNAPSDPKLRSLAEREAVLIEALHSYACGAAHNDQTTKDFQYTRTNANTVLATAAGIIGTASERS